MKKEQDRLVEWLYSQELESVPAVMEAIAAGKAGYATGRLVTEDEAKQRLARRLS